jgi:nitroreductase
MEKNATTTVPVHPLIAGRWSPRGFDAAHALTPDDLTALLEAARWAPSAMNIQPWRFLVAHRGEPAYDALFDVLMPGNQAWAGAAGTLILVAAQTVTADGKPNHYALYDTGQAVAGLTAQAHHAGLAVHQMGGFDRKAAARRFTFPDGVEPVVVVAVGRFDADAALAEPFAERERAPRTRHEIEELLLDAQPLIAV